MILDALAFGAHADDAELSCGGTLIKLAGMGYKTGVIALTRGETGTRGSAEIRAREFAKAAEVMGLAVHKMLDIPDGRVEVTWENKLKIIAEIRAHKPRIVFAPHGIDRHPDHENASQLVRASAYLAGLKKIETAEEAFRPVKVVFCQSRFEFAPSFIVDITDVQPQKMNAIRAYASQFHRPDPSGIHARDGGNAHRPARIPGAHRGPGQEIRRPDRGAIRGGFSRPGSPESGRPGRVLRSGISVDDPVRRP